VALGLEVAYVPYCVSFYLPTVAACSGFIQWQQCYRNFNSTHAPQLGILLGMKITKLEHACLDITQGSDRLIVDPGIFSASLTNFAGVTALVITHIHPDHLDIEKVKAILQQSPNVQTFSTPEVAERLSGTQVTVPEVGQQYTVGAFTLEFFGGQHAQIIEGYPAPGLDHNVGVLINETLYYTGDSLVACPKPHAVLATPSMAPWLKTVEAANFITADTANRVFPTHNHFLSPDGEGIINNLLSGVAERSNKTYLALQPGESIEA
jgi:L-ascorbate metabolism protein UlaG (beta-lactamase superfamily)